MHKYVHLLFLVIVDHPCGPISFWCFLTEKPKFYVPSKTSGTGNTLGQLYIQVFLFVGILLFDSSCYRIRIFGSSKYLKIRYFKSKLFTINFQNTQYLDIEKTTLFTKRAMRVYIHPKGSLEGWNLGACLVCTPICKKKVSISSQDGFHHLSSHNEVEKGIIISRLPLHVYVIFFSKFDPVTWNLSSDEKSSDHRCCQMCHQ